MSHTHFVVYGHGLLASVARPQLPLAPEWLPSGWGIVLQMVAPIVGFAAIAPVLWWFFRDTWRSLDEEAASHRQQLAATDKSDYRPAVCFAICAVILTLQYYYGGASFYGQVIYPYLLEVETAQVTAPGGVGQYVNVARYNELYSYSWWAFTRVAGYTLIPILLWKAIYRKDSILDMGLRVRGFTKHAWIYGLSLLVVVPLVFLVSRSPDFANYYPFYKKCSRSWFDLIAWETLYVAQFFGLELFFRGFWLAALRKTLGSGAIFAMCVPYVMIHFGKPYLETCGALVAGIFLGSLAMKTRSIYSGFLVHITVALLMDGLAVWGKHGFPQALWPGT